MNINRKQKNIINEKCSFIFVLQEMGIPIKRFICASNANNVLTEFINTGRYDIQRRRLVKTISPAIDILVSSNLERYLYHVSNENSYLVNSCFGSLSAQKCFEVPPDVSMMKYLFVKISRKHYTLLRLILFTVNQKIS